MYVSGTRKIIFSYDDVFDQIFSSVLAYTPQHYAEANNMCMDVPYTPYATYSKE